MKDAKKINYFLLSLVITVIVNSYCWAGPNCVTVGGHIAAVSEKLLDQAIKFAVKNDYVALQELMNSGLVIMLKDNIPVYLEDTKMFSGKAKIRLPGSTISVWTVIEGVKCN